MIEFASSMSFDQFNAVNVGKINVSEYIATYEHYGKIMENFMESVSKLWVNLIFKHEIIN